MNMWYDWLLLIIKIILIIAAVAWIFANIGLFYMLFSAIADYLRFLIRA